MRPARKTRRILVTLRRSEVCIPLLQEDFVCARKRRCSRRRKYRVHNQDMIRHQPTLYLETGEQMQPDLNADH